MLNLQINVFSLFLNSNPFSIVILSKSIVIYKDIFAMTHKKSYAARINYYFFYKMAVLFGKTSPTFPELPLSWSFNRTFFLPKTMLNMFIE